jgi:hypothetical protein
VRKGPALVLLVSIASTLTVIGVPDLGGTWKLNVDKSDFGLLPPPYSLEERIEHKEPSLVVHWKYSGAEGALSGTSTYKTDGSKSTNLFGDIEIVSTAAWEGDSLRIESVGMMGGIELEFQDTWKLSEDGQTITIDRFMTSAMGDANQTLVLEKQ